MNQVTLQAAFARLETAKRNAITTWSVYNLGGPAADYGPFSAATVECIAANLVLQNLLQNQYYA